MSFLPVRRTRATSPRSRRDQAGATPRRARVGMEFLEDRAVPAVFTVNSLADVLRPGPGVVTLRSAIQAANNTPGGNTINLAVAGTYRITLPGANTGTNASGAFAVLPGGGNLTIQNTSRGAVTVDAGFMDRAFDINPSAQTTTPFLVTIQGLTVENGDASPGDGAAGSGGGVRDQGAASLSLINDTVTNCFATADGGGVSMENTVNTPWRLTIQNSNVTNCHAGDAGGGVEEDGQGLVSITNSNISNDTTVNQGAGLWLDAVNNVTANTTLTGDTFSNDVAFNGPTGAIGNAGNATVTISGSVVSNNFVGGTAQGGAGFGDENGLGNLSVTNSLFLNNVAVTNGGAIFAGNTGTTTAVTNTLIQGNVAQNGGGIEDPGSSLTLTDVTLDGNHAVANNGGTGGNGGGLDVSNAAGTGTVTVSVADTLFTNDTAVNAPSPSGAEGLLSGSSSSTFAGDGGGIFQATGDLTVQNSQFTGDLASVDGGGILFLGRTLTLSAVTLNNDQAVTDAGGGLALMPTGLAANGQGSSVTNSTLTGDTTRLAGGGIAFVGPGDLALLYDTINANAAVTEGGGVAFVAQSGTPVFSVQNTIIAGNTAGTGPDVFSMGSAVTDLGGNLVPTAGQGNTGFKAGTLTTSPRLSTLQNNGGPFAGVNPFPGFGGRRQVVQTEALKFNSPAVGNAVKVALPVTDERGFPRPGVVFGNPSIGAFEPQYIGAPSQSFVVGGDGQVYARHTDTAGNPTGGYYAVAPGQVKALQVVHLGDSGTELFVIGTDNQVYVATVDANGNTGGYAAAAPGLVASIAAGTDAAGNPVLFAVGLDNQLYELQFDASGNPTGSYTKAAMGQFRSAALTHDAAGNPLAYAVGQDGQVYGLKLDAAADPVGGLFKAAPGGVKQLAVTADASGNPELFVVGLDGGAYGLKTDASGSPVGGYFPLHALVRSIAAGADASNHPIVFAVGLDGQVYGQKFEAGGTPVGGFYATAPVSGGVSSISVGADAVDRPEVFAVLPDNQVYVQPFDAAGNSTGGFTLYAAGQVKAQAVR